MKAILVISLVIVASLSPLAAQQAESAAIEGEWSLDVTASTFGRSLLPAPAVLSIHMSGRDQLDIALRSDGLVRNPLARSVSLSSATKAGSGAWIGRNLIVATKDSRGDMLFESLRIEQSTGRLLLVRQHSDRHDEDFRLVFHRRVEQ